MKGLGSVSHLCLGEGGLCDDTLALPVNEQQLRVTQTGDNTPQHTDRKTFNFSSCTNQKTSPHSGSNRFCTLRISKCLQGVELRSALESSDVTLEDLVEQLLFSVVKIGALQQETFNDKPGRAQVRAPIKHGKCVLNKQKGAYL